MTRDRIRTFRERLTVLGQTFARTIREDTRAIRVTPDRLAGLPDDWIAAHPTDANGLVTVTTDHPDAIPFHTFAHDADAPHYAEKHRRERFGVDAQRVRTHFDVARVRDGVLAVTGRLFGLVHTPRPDAPTWHESVTVHDVTRSHDSTAVGRISLDLRPREGQFTHAAQFPLASGVRDVQLPEGTLVCNFPTGLMEHAHVTTFFHEFGHLVHHLISGHQHWKGFSGVATEWDVVEAPNQLLEEWAWDAAVLASFATNAAGEPIPADPSPACAAPTTSARAASPARRCSTRRCRTACTWRTPTTSSPAPASCRSATRRSPASRAPARRRRSATSTATAPGTPRTCGRSSSPRDPFSAFDRTDLLAPEVARRHRDRVLAPGGSKDAAELVRDSRPRLLLRRLRRLAGRVGAPQPPGRPTSGGQPRAAAAVA